MNWRNGCIGAAAVLLAACGSDEEPKATNAAPEAEAAPEAKAVPEAEAAPEAGAVPAA